MEEPMDYTDSEINLTDNLSSCILQSLVKAFEKLKPSFFRYCADQYRLADEII
jgi:hypothetical protein